MSAREICFITIALATGITSSRPGGILALTGSYFTHTPGKHKNHQSLQGYNIMSVEPLPLCLTERTCSFALPAEKGRTSEKITRLENLIFLLITLPLAS
ncbi:hypothetical protein F5141DRAFT_384202 [Pisolithus sp. B1]|nr:hypothetical protein F5141DRAFT_384202 [Pisolithus sp. B1]